MKSLLIVGAGAFARELLDWLRDHPDHGVAWRVAGFLDDDPGRSLPAGIDVGWRGTVADHRPSPGEVFACGIGRQGARRTAVERLRSRGAAFPTIIHPTARVGSRNRLGEGVILCPGAIVTCDAVLGDFVTLNLHAVATHDVRVGDFCQVNDHADLCGGCRLGRDVWTGSRVSVLPGVVVGDGALLGAGAIVARDVPAGAVVAGAPARLLPPAGVAAGTPSPSVESGCP